MSSPSDRPPFLSDSGDPPSPRTRSLRAHLTDAAIDVFRANGVHLDTHTDVHTDAIDAAVTAIMDVRLASGTFGPPSPAPGKLALVSSFGLVARSRPIATRVAPLSPESFGDWLFVRDWMRDLLGQLARRLATRLEDAGATVAFGRPVALTREAAIREVSSTTCIQIRLRGPDRGGVDVYLTLPGTLDEA